MSDKNRTERGERIENLLVVLLLNALKGSTVAEKAHQLNLAGFTNIEIADFLETSTGVIAQSLYDRKKKKTKKKN